METNPYANLYPERTNAETLSLVDTLNAAAAPSRIESQSRRQFLLAAGTGAAAVTALGGATVWAGLTGESDEECQPGSVIAPPLQGEWLVMNPPGHPELADDFIGMKADRRFPYPVSSVPRHLLHTMPVSQTYGWGRPVYAPVGGTVLEMSNQEPDRTHMNLLGDAFETLVAPPAVEAGDIRPAAGNYIVIEAKEGVAFLAHLRQGSVVVSEGTDVVHSQFLGEVGNSGASLIPHLHFQLMREWTTNRSKVEETLLPYRFSRYEQRTGNGLTGHAWEPVQHCVPAQRERFRVPPNDHEELNIGTDHMGFGGTLETGALRRSDWLEVTPHSNVR